VWQRRSPSQLGGRVWSYETRGSVGAHLNREAGSGAMGRVAAPEPTSIGRRGSVLRDTWRLVVARSTTCLVFMLVREGTRSTGYRQSPKMRFRG
jgi:hypothetical protein